jgi:NAD+ kinase
MDNTYMKNFYIYSNQTKDDNGKMAKYIRDYIHLKGGVCSDTVNDKVEAIIVLGGDGTMLSAARECVNYHIPFIGVNLGTLGYMTEVDKEEIAPAIDNLMAGNYDIEPRMMLSGIPVINGESSDPQIALNDIVINRAGALHVINFNIYVNGSLLSSYHADGMIISTPTGSTAYNLSAGGPIVEPRARLIMMTPVCSHTLVNNRTIILAEDDVIDIEIGEYKPAEEQVVNASFDGRYPVQLNEGDKIRIIRADKSTKIIKIGGASFLDTLHKKMGIC